jgi:uncharacterized membrane protein
MSKKLSSVQFAIATAFSFAVANVANAASVPCETAAADTACQCTANVKQGKNDCQVPGKNSCAAQSTKDGEEGAWILVKNKNVCDLILKKDWSDKSTAEYCERLTECNNKK